MKKSMGLAIALLLIFGSVAGASAAETKVIKMTAEKYKFTPDRICGRQAG